MSGRYNLLKTQCEHGIEQCKSVVNASLSKPLSLQSLRLAIHDIIIVINTQRGLLDATMGLDPKEKQMIENQMRTKVVGIPPEAAIAKRLRDTFPTESDTANASLISTLVGHVAKQIHKLDVMRLAAEAMEQEEEADFTLGPGVE